MGRYFRKLLNGNALTDTDHQFAANNSDHIVNVLHRIWPCLGNSQALINDHGEEYNLLSDPSFKPSELGPFLREIIEKETIWSDHVFLLLSRPMLKVKPAISTQLVKAERSGDVICQLYSLVLSEMKDKKVLSKLKVMYNKNKLNNYQRKVVSVLIGKIERGEKIVFADVEDLEYQDN